MAGPNGKRFLLPTDRNAHDYLFLATGTGIAPFRGFIHELFVGPPAGSPRPAAGAPFGALPAGTIEGPVPWPLAPIRPGQNLTLQLRPLEGGPNGFAVVRLIGSPAGQLARGDALLAGLGRDPHRWRLAVEAAMERGDLPLASALLFAFEGPGAPDLNALRLTVIRRSCQPAEGPPR